MMKKQNIVPPFMQRLMQLSGNAIHHDQKSSTQRLSFKIFDQLLMSTHTSKSLILPNSSKKIQNPQFQTS